MADLLLNKSDADITYIQAMNHKKSDDNNTTNKNNSGGCTTIG